MRKSQESVDCGVEEKKESKFLLMLLIHYSAVVLQTPVILVKRTVFVVYIMIMGSWII